MSEPKQIEIAILDGDAEFIRHAVEDAISDSKSSAEQLELAERPMSCCYFQQASTLYDAIASAPAVDLDTLRLVAKRWFKVGRFQRAAEVMRTALRRSSSEEVLVELAGCLERSGELDEAEALLRTALKSYPSSAPAKRLLAHLYRRRERFDEATVLLNEHLIRFPGSWDWGMRYELANIYDRIGQYDAAWQQITLAKGHFKSTVDAPLASSIKIRQRQASLALAVTNNDLSRWRDTKCEQTLNIALMGGFPRSGTTLLEGMLRNHTECVGTDESSILSRQFIAPIVWDAPEAIDALLEIRGFETNQISAGRREYIRATESYLDSKIDHRTLIEKDPLLTADLPLLLRLFPDAKIIMPLRDPRDVAISYFFTMVPLNWSSAPAISIEQTARFYHDCMRHWLLFRDRLDWPWHEVRYEEIVDDASGCLQKLIGFLELPWQNQILATENRNHDRHVKTPTYDDVTKPIYRRSVKRWHNYEKYLQPAREILDKYAKEFKID